MLDKNGHQTTDGIKEAFGEDAMKPSTIYRRFKSLVGDRRSVSDNSHKARPRDHTTNENEKAAKALNDTDRQVTLRELAHGKMHYNA